MKKNTKGVILEQKGAKMAEDGEDWNGLEMTNWLIFSRQTNNDVAPLINSRYDNYNNNKLDRLNELADQCMFLRNCLPTPPQT